jgi:hypothetical protein
MQVDKKDVKKQFEKVRDLALNFMTESHILDKIIKDH